MAVISFYPQQQVGRNARYRWIIAEYATYFPLAFSILTLRSLPTTAIPMQAILPKRTILILSANATTVRAALPPAPPQFFNTLKGAESTSSQIFDITPISWFTVKYLMRLKDSSDIRSPPQRLNLRRAFDYLLSSKVVFINKY